MNTGSKVKSNVLLTTFQALPFGGYVWEAALNFRTAFIYIILDICSFMYKSQILDVFTIGRVMHLAGA
jgi:hypothetical protein